MSDLDGKLVCLIYLVVLFFIYITIYFSYTANKRYSPFYPKGGNLVASKDETGGEIIKPVVPPTKNKTLNKKNIKYTIKRRSKKIEN